MLKKMISMLCIIPFLIPITYDTHNYLNFTIAEVDKVNNDLKGIDSTIVKIEKGIIPYKTTYEKDMLNEISNGLINQQRERARQDEIKRQEEVVESTMDFILTFYTSLDCENGYGNGITCTGSKMYDGIVANNILKLGTIIKLDGFGEVTVGDRGGRNFNTSNRLDVYIPKLSSESNSEYYRRVQKMGKIVVKGRIIK